MSTEHIDNNRQKIIAAFVVMVAVVLISGAAQYYHKPASATNTMTPTSPSNSTTGTTNAATNTTDTPNAAIGDGAHKDGTYTATSTYFVPRSNETITVTLTLKDDIVTTASVENSEGDPESARFQERFTDSYKSQVVGKNIADVHLTFVAGASDTTDGFNEAVNQIIRQAET